VKKLALAAALAAVACGAISFDVSQAVPEQQVPGSPLGGLLPSFLPQPFPVTINIQQETAKRSTGPASSANLKQVEFQMTPHGSSSSTFDFVDEIHIFVAPSGKVHCARAGGVREQDFAVVEKLFAE